MEKKVITYKEDDGNLMIVYGVEGKIIYVAIYPQEKNEDYEKCLNGYLKDGYTIENPDNMTDEDLQQTLFDMTVLLLYEANVEREQK